MPISIRQTLCRKESTTKGTVHRQADRGLLVEHVCGLPIVVARWAHERPFTARTCDSSIDDWPTSIRHALQCDGKVLWHQPICMLCCSNCMCSRRGPAIRALTIDQPLLGTHYIVKDVTGGTIVMADLHEALIERQVVLDGK